MVSNLSLSSDVVGILSMKRKRKVVSIEKKLVDILLYQKNMVLEKRLYMTSFKVRID